MATGGDNIQARCQGNEYRGGIGPTFRFSNPGGRFAVSLHARAYRLQDFSSCDADLVPPPANGTTVFENRHTLVGDKFVTTDARAEYRAAGWLGVGAGGGVAWHEGVDFPYALVSAEVLAVSRPGMTLGFGLELYGVRVATDRTQVTLVNSQIVASEPLPRVRSWSHAVAITARVSFPLSPARALISSW